MLQNIIIFQSCGVDVLILIKGFFFRLSRMKKERSCSGGMFDFSPSSPNLSRRSKENKHQMSSSSTRLRHLQTANAATLAQLVDLTVFHIPGLDVKVCH